MPWLRTAEQARVFARSLPADGAVATARLEEAVVILTARHGRVFEQARWKDLLARQPWYQPSRHYDPARLSEGEREALTLLLEALRARS